MKRALLSLFVLSLAGCVADATIAEGDAPADVEAADALSRYTLDSTRLTPAASQVAPVKALRAEALTGQNVSAALLRAPVSPSVFKTVGTRTEYRVMDWELETDSATGRIMANRVAAVAAAAPQNELLLRADSLARLGELGVDPAEVGEVAQRKVMTESREDGVMTSAPELHSYKTFIARSINGIPVQGHRAVLTHAKDGSLRKVLVAWPALATTGHRLTSRLSLTQVKTRA
ncbi:MAG: hypothetical protein JNK82_18850, partial [Myxococcaceae bacterium]|nr:hypothetical protein [Myxococcaceae bacterium]